MKPGKMRDMLKGLGLVMLLVLLSGGQAQPALDSQGQIRVTIRGPGIEPVVLVEYRFQLTPTENREWVLHVEGEAFPDPQGLSKAFPTLIILSDRGPFSVTARFDARFQLLSYCGEFSVVANDVASDPRLETLRVEAKFDGKTLTLVLERRDRRRELNVQPLEPFALDPFSTAEGSILLVPILQSAFGTIPLQVTVFNPRPPLEGQPLNSLQLLPLTPVALQTPQGAVEVQRLLIQAAKESMTADRPPMVLFYDAHRLWGLRSELVAEGLIAEAVRVDLLPNGLKIVGEEK